MREEFRYIISEWLSRDLPETVERGVKIDLSADKIIVIAGVRRAGKTYLLFDIIKKLVAARTPRKNILYINFDDDRLINLTSSDLNDMLSVYLELSEPEKNNDIFLFLDEIQNVKNWELWVRRIYDSKKYRIFITGSSSKLLSREIATTLVGRNITYTLYPFSFKEFLIARGIKTGKRLLYGEERHRINALANAYLINGGFPEIAFEKEKETRQRIISAYYDAILYRDIISRYRIEDASGNLASELKWLYLMRRLGASFSILLAINLSGVVAVDRDPIFILLLYGFVTQLIFGISMVPPLRTLWLSAFSLLGL